MATYEIKVYKYNQEGDLAHEYRPLRNLKLADQTNDIDGNTVQPKDLGDFVTTEIPVKLNKPLDIECQPSYDGTVNLIINDDENPPRIINTRFSVIEDNRYRIINRNQEEQTNIYNEGYVDRESRLFRNINRIPRIALTSVNSYGQLKGGNYTFYIKYGDNDYNKTDIVAESGQISIFKGTISKPNTISGTLQDERTDKAISLTINNIDTSFQKIYLFYSREYCDINGTRTSEVAMIKEPYEITNTTLNISINGFEDIETLNDEELNIQYNIVTAVKTQAQVQSMLFFGNVQDVHLNNIDLQALSYYIQVSPIQSAESIGCLTTEYTKQENDDIDQVEYYNPMNIYYHLGYWPDEMYRIGIVYIMKDDSLSAVFNLRGCEFNSLNQLNIDPNEHWYDEDRDPNDPIEDWAINYLPKEKWMTNSSIYSNTMGVFKMPKEEEFHIQTSTETKPLGLKMTFPDNIWRKLKSLNVKGFFFVRQKRIPTTLCQGLSVGVDRACYIPMMYIGSPNDYINNPIHGPYLAESFINNNGTLTTEFNNRKQWTYNKQISGLLCVDAYVNPTLQSTFDGSEFYLEHYKQCKIRDSSNRYFQAIPYNGIPNDGWTADGVNSTSGLIYINDDIPFKFLNEQSYSTRVGAAEEVKQIGFLGTTSYNADARNLIRGVFTSFIGTTSNLTDSSIYSIKIQNYSTVFLKQYFEIRGNDNSPFFAISDRYEIENIETKADYTCFRGDCYTCTVTTRLQRNFIDSDVPVNNTIVEPDTWKNNYNGYNTTEEEAWLSINRADINSVPIGSWVTWKCLSNYNLGIRSIDSTNVEEMALMGNPRSFYPLSGYSASVGNKLAESTKYNDGYSSTVGRKRYLGWVDVPYEKDMFDNRIMFSNVQQNDAFRNAYRIFQGLSYKDIDRQYGGIVKMISWGPNILCVFEHGISIIPINEKALMQTTTGQSIHMYGAGVIQDQLTVISQDYGSIWPESVIRTPIGVYGVDTYAKKIWRFSNEKGLELISDAKIQRFLNDNINLREKDKYPIIALKNVKSHYNNYKGDIMFTFYNDNTNTEWNICYNERLDKWITRYSWIPLYSDNVNNIYCSLDKKRAEILAYIYDNLNTTSGLTTNFIDKNTENQWNNRNSNLIIPLKMVGSTFYNRYEFKIEKVGSSYINSNGEEIFIELPSTQYSVTSYQQAEASTGNHGSFTLNSTASSYIDNSGTHALYYWKISLAVTPYAMSDAGQTLIGNTTYEVIGIVVNYDNLNTTEKEEYETIMENGFYVHGRAGIFDEIDYFDEDRENNILPTKWYGKQEPFEFEFVVNNAVGAHKIFNDLVIISNKVQPTDIEFEIVGDVYHFNKAGIFWSKETGDPNKEWSDKYNPALIYVETGTRETWAGPIKVKTSQNFDNNVSIRWDPILNQYMIDINQECKNIKEWGRLKGNIQYKEDAWYLNIEPIKFYKKTKEIPETGSIDNVPEVVKEDINSTRIRDKWLKIRVKYSGKDLAVITALKTMMTLSYS